MSRLGCDGVFLREVLEGGVSFLIDYLLGATMGMADAHSRFLRF